MSDLILDQNAPMPQDDTEPKPALDLGPGAPTSPQPMNPADIIIESDTQNFARDVIEASVTHPVIVDFWAPWCGPCKTLGPMLEKMVTRAGGLVKMVKINVDENQGLAAQLRVQSVPTVFAFKEGKPVDAFAGALPESQIKAFIDKLLGDAKSPVDALMDQAHEALKAGDPYGAEQLYTEVLGQDPTMVPAFAGILRAIAQQGDIARARDMLSRLDAKTLASADVQQAISALDLAEEAQAAGSAETDALEQRVADNPKDLDARYELAQAQFAAGQTDSAIDNLLEIVSIDRAWNDEAGRKQLLKIFDTIGPMDPVTVDARKRLSAILFS